MTSPNDRKIAEEEDSKARRRALDEQQDERERWADYNRVFRDLLEQRRYDLLLEHMGAQPAKAPEVFAGAEADFAALRGVLLRLVGQSQLLDANVKRELTERLQSVGLDHHTRDVSQQLFESFCELYRKHTRPNPILDSVANGGRRRTLRKQDGMLFEALVAEVKKVL